MRLVAVICLLAVLAGFPAVAADKPVDASAEEINPVYRELAKVIRGDDVRSKSARLQLEFAEGNNRRWFPPVRKPVKTVDGKNAEVVFIKVPSGSMPGEDFTMALLLVNGRCVDWASCWTSNRIARQELLLEDVDGDGAPDVAFRASDGFWALQDDRQHRRPNDKRVWLAAYSITSKGFRPIFANKERIHRLKIATDQAAGPLAFRVTGLPESLAESDLCDCTVSVTNTSESPVPLAREHFFPKFEGGGFTSIRPQSNLPATIQPGQTISEIITLRFESDQDVVNLQWSVRPTETKRERP